MIALVFTLAKKILILSLSFRLLKSSSDAKLYSDNTWFATIVTSSIFKTLCSFYLLAYWLDGNSESKGCLTESLNAGSLHQKFL